MGKARIFELMRQGNTKEVEIMGETFILRDPDLEDQLAAIEMDEAMEKGDKKAIDLRAQIVMNCILDKDGELYFKKGDIDLVRGDRSGLINKLLEAIAEKIVEEKDVEGKKKK